MIVVRLFFVSWLILAGRNDAAIDPASEKSPNDTKLGYFSSSKLFGGRGIDEVLLDRDWDRYLDELTRLKVHEMKRAIRSRVLDEKIRPPFTLKHIRRRLELLKLYDPVNVEVGHVRDTLRGNSSSYRTASGQSILYMKISETDRGDRDDRRGHETARPVARPVIVIVAGMEGSDWIAVHVIMHVLTNLVTSYDAEKLLGFDWWIIPLLNPDGYVTSMISRDYRPNVNPTAGCWGVNLDRNFLFQRGRCRERRLDCQEYPGKNPFSEVESRALRNFIISRVENCKVFVALKEGAKALVYPFASTVSAPPGPYTTLQNLLCVEALEAFEEFHNGKRELFRFGNSGSIFGASSGYVEDWAKRHMGIPRSFAFYIANHDDRSEPPVRFDEYGRGALKAIVVLATSRRSEPSAETFDELITNGTRPHDLSKRRESRPVPWARELIHVNLRSKINRGANLEMPEEFTRDAANNGHDRFDFGGEK